jgi:hypothetical protein
MHVDASGQQGQSDKHKSHKRQLYYARMTPAGQSD